MRISDWSSDVCSSDLLFALSLIRPQRFAQPSAIFGNHSAGGGQNMLRRAVILFEADDLRPWKILLELQDIGDFRSTQAIDALVIIAHASDILPRLRHQTQPRSEEQTSELQSHMRISYAIQCLTKETP